jgi:hypothetical protein
MAPIGEVADGPEAVEGLLARRREAYRRLEGLMAGGGLAEALATAETVRELEGAILEKVEEGSLADVDEIAAFRRTYLDTLKWLADRYRAAD